MWFDEDPEESSDGALVRSRLSALFLDNSSECAGSKHDRRLQRREYGSVGQVVGTARIGLEMCLLQETRPEEQDEEGRSFKAADGIAQDPYFYVCLQLA